jgi:hypothetical protein
VLLLFTTLATLDVALRKRSNLRELKDQEVQLEQEAQAKEQARVDQAKLDQAKLDQEKLDQAKVDQAKLDQAKLDQAKVDQAKLDQARLDQVKLNQEKLDQAKLDQVKLNQAKLDQAKLDQAKLNQARQDQAKLDQSERDSERVNQGRELQTEPVTPASKSGPEKLDSQRSSGLPIVMVYVEPADLPDAQAVLEQVKRTCLRGGKFALADSPEAKVTIRFEGIQKKNLRFSVTGLGGTSTEATVTRQIINNGWSADPVVGAEDVCKKL